MALTPKQEAFVRAYLETGNASEAYRRAYDVAPSTKGNTVEKRAHELLRNDKVAGRLADEQAKLSQRHAVTMDRLLAEYASIAFADPGQFFEWGPHGVTVKAKQDLTPEQRRVVGELSQTITQGGGTIRVKLHDKLDALNALGKHLGFFRDEVRDPAELTAQAHAVTAKAILALAEGRQSAADRDRDREIDREVERRIAARLRGLPAPPKRQALPVLEHEGPQPARTAVRWPAQPADDPPQPSVMSASAYFEQDARRGRRSSRSDTEYDEFGGD